MAAPNLSADTPWLYRQGDLVLGPVDAASITRLLEEGSLTATSEIAPLGSSEFHPVGEVEPFVVIAAKAATRQRLLAAEAQADQARTRRLAIRLGVLGVIGVLLLGGAIAGARYLAVHGTFSSSSDVAAISVEPPTISLARAGSRSEGLLAYGVEAEEEAAPTAGSLKPRTPASASSGSRTRRPASASTAASTGRAMASTGSDGLELAQLDQASINAVVASQQKTLYGCLQLVAKRFPGKPTRIPIEFVIGNNGSVSKLWIDHPDFKQGELHTCMLGKLKAWRFKPYEGEQATVNLAFNVG
ncbi:MAG TPA: AgmX/PglI C-terminal domain-containing protein [Myxococcaceae bacterium]|nr:AgmX/PglI C-terminal domain-containing protein [Myxococcaceae bacterium]